MPKDKRTHTHTLSLFRCTKRSVIFELEQFQKVHWDPSLSRQKKLLFRISFHVFLTILCSFAGIEEPILVPSMKLPDPRGYLHSMVRDFCRCLKWRPNGIEWFNEEMRMRKIWAPNVDLQLHWPPQNRDFHQGLEKCTTPTYMKQHQLFNLMPHFSLEGVPLNFIGKEHWQLEDLGWIN